MADDELTIRVNLQTTEATKASEKLATDIGKALSKTRNAFGFGTPGMLLSGMPILGIGTGPIVQALGDVNALATGASGRLAEETAGIFFGKTGPQFVQNMRSSFGRYAAGAKAQERVASLARALGAQGVNLEDDALRAVSEIAFAQEANAERQARRAFDLYTETSGGWRGAGSGNAGDKIEQNLAEGAVSIYDWVKKLVNSGAASAQSR